MKTYQMIKTDEALRVSKDIDVQTARMMTLARAERVGEATQTTETVTQEFLDNCTDADTIKFFESLGGREEKRNLLDGLELTSYSPNFDGIVQVTRRIFKEA